MRERFATAAHIEAENRIAADIGERWGISFKRMPDRYWFDFLGERDGKPALLMEVKCRPDVRRHPDYSVSLQKVLKGRELSQAMGIPAIIMLHDGERLSWVDVAETYEHGWVFVGKARDDQDEEPAAVFRWDQFTDVKAKSDAAS